jgi:hypothetical protein
VKIKTHGWPSELQAISTLRKSRASPCGLANRRSQIKSYIARGKILAIRLVAADIANMINVQISLPDRLAQEAQRAGLLDSETLAAILRERLAVTQVERLQQARAKLGANPLPAMSAQEIREEIVAYRAEKQRAAGR